MSVIRCGRDAAGGTAAFALALCERLTDHSRSGLPCASFLIGVGDPMLIHHGDPRPRVLIPLVGVRHVDAISRTQITSSDAVVVIDPAEAAAIAPFAPPIAVMAGGPGGDGVLAPPSPLDRFTVRRVLGTAPALAQTLGIDPATGFDDGVGAVVDAAIEAAIAAGATVQ